MFSQFFVDRPKFAFVISILMMLAGLICITQIPVAEYPEVSPPSVQVSMTYSGASSEELAQVIAAPVEEQLIGLENLEYFSSKSNSNGTYSLSLTFAAGANDDMAQVNVTNAISRVESKLPAEVKQTGYQVNKRSSDMLCTITFMGDPTKISDLELTNWVRANVRDRLGRVPGVSESAIMSNRSYAMRIWLKPTRMSALGITPADVSQAIQEQNVQAAAGSVGSQDDDSFATFTITATGRLKTVEEFSSIIVKNGENGHITRLRDIATIELGAEANNAYTRFDGKDAVGIRISRTNTANALDTVKLVQAELTALEASFPEGVSWSMSYDPTLAIEATMKEILITLVLALLLVVFVTYVFLQDWRATIIPVVCIPVSLLGAFTVMFVLGYSINVLTMFGLILVIGSLVDDAIVVVENVTRLMHEEHLSAYEATSKGMKQITSAVIATTLVTLAVYVPIAFYGGMVGQIYTQFSVTMCIALSISTFNALTLSPALCALLLREPKKGERKKISAYLFAPFNLFLDFCRKIYMGGTGLLVRNAWLTVLIMLLVAGGNYYYFKGIPMDVIQKITGMDKMSEEEKKAMIAQRMKEAQKNVSATANPARLLIPTELRSSFVPTEDKGVLFVMIMLEGTATAKQRTNAVVQEVEKRINKIKGVNHVFASAGFSFVASGENVGMCIVILDPWEERAAPELHVKGIQAQINAACASIPEAVVMAQTPPAIQGLGIAGGVSLVLQASGDATPAILGDMVKELSAQLTNYKDASGRKLVQMTRSNYTSDTPQIELEINREKAQSLGIPVKTIFTTLQSLMASSYINDFTLNGFSFKVIMQGSADNRRSADDIMNVLVRSNTGEMVPLSAVCSLSYRMGPPSYERFEQLMSAAITVIPAMGVSSGEVMTLIEQLLAEQNDKERAAGRDILWQSSWEALSYQERQNEGKIGSLLVLAVIFAYLFLVAQYESWTTPVPVLLSVSVATLGALMGAQLFGLSFSIYVQLGILMLIGLASKNAVLIVEFAKEEHERGTAIQKAALLGANQRFRAVLMTAISFLCGVFPMVVGTGAGAASRQEIGITTFCGMLLATFWGIFMVPALYSIFARMRDFTASLFKKKQA